MEDLSAPFLDLTAVGFENTTGIAEAMIDAATSATDAAASAAASATTTATAFNFKGDASISPFIKKYWLFLIIGLVGLLLIYKLAQTENLEEEPKEKAPQESPLQLAQKYYHLYKKSPNNKVKNYKLATYYFEQSLNEIFDPRIILTLAKLYHEGVTDHYDSNNVKVAGIPPNADKAIYFYTLAIKSGNTRSLLDLASIYHWGLGGSQGIKPAPSYAKALYALLQKVGTKYDQGIAKDRLLQILEEEGKVLGTEGGVDGAIVQNFASELLGGSPFSENFASLSQIGESPAEAGGIPLTDGIDPNYIETLKHEFNQTDPGIRNQNLERSGLIKNNPESARDHMVVNTSRLSLEKLKSKTHVQFDASQVMTQIRSFLENNMSNSQKKTNILRVLTYLAKGQYSGDFEHTKGLDTLVLVWNRIMLQSDNKKKLNMINNLLNELSECVEYGDIVCASGVITRILDSLNFVDSEVKIMPEWMIRDEMLSKASIIRDTMLKKAPGRVRDALETPHPSPQDTQIANQFIEKYKKKLWDVFHKDYVDSSIMTSDLLKTQLNEWIDHIF